MYNSFQEIKLRQLSRFYPGNRALKFPPKELLSMSIPKELSDLVRHALYKNFDFSVISDLNSSPNQIIFSTKDGNNAYFSILNFGFTKQYEIMFDFFAIFTDIQARKIDLENIFKYKPIYGKKV